MSNLALLFYVSLVVMPGQGGDFSAAKMASRPLPDKELKPGTISVLVRRGKLGVQGVHVWLLLAGSAKDGKPKTDSALTGGKTDANGRVYLKGGNHVGRRVVVWVKLSKGHQKSVPFQIPALGGVRLMFLAGGSSPHGAGAGMPPSKTGGHGHGMGKATPRGPLTKDPSKLRLWVSVRIMAIENEKIYLALTYSVLNRGRATYHAGEHGLLLPLPKGAKGATVPRGTRGASVLKGKLMTQRPVPSGRHGLQIQASCHLPYDEETELLLIRSHVPIIGYSVALKKYRTVRIDGKGLGKPETIKHGDAAAPWLIYRSGTDGFPRNQVRFGITGLPVRSRAGAWLFGGLAALLVLVAFGLTVARRRRRKADHAEGDKTGDHLVRIERDRLLGVLTNAQARQHAERVLKESD